MHEHFEYFSEEEIEDIMRIRPRHPLYNPAPDIHFEIEARRGRHFFLKEYDGILQFDDVTIMFGENEIQSGIVINREEFFKIEGVKIACYSQEGWSEQINDKSILVIKKDENTI